MPQMMRKVLQKSSRNIIFIIFLKVGIIMNVFTQLHYPHQNNRIFRTTQTTNLTLFPLASNEAKSLMKIARKSNFYHLCKYCSHIECILSIALSLSYQN